MSYIRQDFKDEIRDSNGNITQEGTVLSSEHLIHIEDGLESALGSETVLSQSDFINGSFSGSKLTTTETNRIRTNLISVKQGNMCSFLLEDGWSGYIAIRNEGASYTVATNWLQSSDYEFETDCEFIIVLRKDDNSTITSADYNSTVKVIKYPTGSEKDENAVRDYYLAEIEATKTSVKELLTEPCLVFPMVSDIHYYVSSECPYSVDYCANNMLELSKELQFDFIACLGDITEGDKTQEIITGFNDHILTQFKKIGVPYYQCVGNHDDNRYGTTFTHAQLYRNFIRNTKDVMFDNKTSMCGTNFYKDFDELGLRCIFLNANNNGAYGYSSDTCDWFDATVESTPDRFIVFTHISPVPAQNYGAKYGTDSGSARIRETCVNSDKFVMLFSGHNHYDASFTEPILSFTINCQKFENENGDSTLWAEGATKPTRVLGTASEDCFDIVVIRPIAKKINRIRFGAGDDQEYTYE